MDRHEISNKNVNYGLNDSHTEIIKEWSNVLHTAISRQQDKANIELIFQCYSV